MLVIVAKYTENTDWIARLPANVRRTVVFDKSPDGDCENVGREAETWVRAICDLWDDLEAFKTVAFLQGHPFDHVDEETLMYELGRPERGGVTRHLCPLGVVLTADGVGRPHHPGLPVADKWKDLVGEYDDIDPSSASRTSWAFVAGAQYIVPTASIITRPLRFWQRLRDLLRTGWVCPWTAERFWLLLFSA